VSRFAIFVNPYTTRADIDPSRTACGAASDCINRLTQVECPAGDCRCGERCQNQRQACLIDCEVSFHITVSQDSEQGLCPHQDCSDREEGLWSHGRGGPICVGAFPPSAITNRVFRDALIIEYIGEVIAHNNFVKRLRDYAESGIRHFYFMALQKDEVRMTAPCAGRLRIGLSTSTRPEKGAVVASSITLATPTATWQNGLSAKNCGWPSSPSARCSVAKSSLSTTTWTATGRPL
jgi:hypothetical protein